MKNRRNTQPDRERNPLSGAYLVIDNDLARDNLESDVPATDLEDLAPIKEQTR